MLSQDGHGAAVSCVRPEAATNAVGRVTKCCGRNYSAPPSLLEATEQWAFTFMCANVDIVRPGCPVRGATRWLAPDRALLVLSPGSKTNDQAWFSFFHKAGHILHHGKKLLFLEGIDGLNADHEAEADRFAANALSVRHERAG